MSRTDGTPVWQAGKPEDAPSPPLDGDREVDVAIVGGGFTGVSTAYQLARRHPQKRVLLLEADALGAGASGRNGGLMLNWINGAHPSDPTHAKAIFDATQAGMALIEGVIREHGLQVPCRRDGVLEVITQDAGLATARAEVEALRSVGVPLELVTGDALAARLQLSGVVGAVLDPTGGHLDGLAYLRALRPVLAGLGVALHEGTPVTRIEEGEPIAIHTARGVVRAGALVLGTNAFSPQLGWFSGGVCAVHSHVIATEPRSPAEWAARGWRRVCGFSDDRSRLSYASMTADGRLVFGGGSNRAYAYRFGNRPVLGAEDRAAAAAVHAQLLAYLPGAADVPIAHRWSGPIALTLNRMCTMGRGGAHDNVYYALGYSGHGIVLANLAGRVLADLYDGDDAAWRGLPFHQRRLSYIPPEPLRWLGYQLFTKLTGRSPRTTLSEE